MKKFLIPLTALGTISIPIVTVIACGNTSNSGDGDNLGAKSKYVDGVLVSTATSKLTEENTTRNFANKVATLSENKNKNEVNARSKNGQPYSLHFHSRDLSNWKPENDPDRYFNKSTIKLRDRKLAAKYIKTQTGRDLDILASLSKSTSYNKMGTVGKETSSDKIFTMWSHISKMIGWGGSASEGNYVIPKGDDVNAAHRNGVPILGTLFMPPNQFGGELKQYEDMVVKKGETYPVADSMIKMASYYGFDGWFLNFETTGVSTKLREKIRGFIKYLYAGIKKAKQFLVLYDFGEGYQYFGDGNFDLAAVDFHNRDEKKNSYNLPKSKTSIGYNYDVGVTTSKDEGGEFDYSKYPDDNLWIYTYFRRHDTVLDGDGTDLEFFSSSEGKRDPRATGTDKWTEMSKYFQDRTTLNSRKVFSTSFEQGFGDNFYVDGIKQPLGSELSNKGYRNIGLQDILPTYTWINDYYDQNDILKSVPTDGEIKVDGKTWKTELVSNELTYYGSSSLKYTGKIEYNHSIESKLYATNFKLKTDDEFSIIERDLGNAEASFVAWTQEIKDIGTMKLNKNILKSSNKINLGNGFSKIIYKIPQTLNGMSMKQFGLKFINNGDDSNSQTKNFEIKISKLSYTPSELLVNKSEPNKILNIRHDGDFIFQGKRNLRINWDMKKNNVDHYRIYSTRDGGYVKNELLTLTSLPAAYLKDIEPGTKLKIIIDAINENNNVLSSTNVEIKTTFKKMNDLKKWSVEWKRPSNTDSKYIIQTNNGYTVSVKIDGELYIGDDYTRIHKVAKNGSFLTSQSNDWGKQILGFADGKDTKILSIFNWDNDHIAVLTSKGTLQLVDKISGKVESDTIFDKNILNNFINNEQGKKNKIKNVLFANVQNENAQIIINLDDESSRYLNINLKTKTVTENTIKSGVKINIIKKDSNGKYVIAYKSRVDTSEKINIIVTDNLKLDALTLTDLLQNKLDTFSNSVDFKNELRKGANVDPDDTSFFANGKIIDLRIVKNKILAINSWGLAISMNLDGTNIQVSSIIDEKNWSELISFVKNYKSENDAAWSEASITTDGKLSTLYKIWDQLFKKRQGLEMSPIQNISFDSDTNQYSYAFINKFKVAWWGHWNFTSSFKFVNMTDFIGNKNTSPTIKTTKSISLSDDDSKKVDSVRFVEKIGEYFIIGGSTGKIAIYDQEFNQVAVGQKIYKYEDKVIQISDKIFNDNDKSIPANLIK